MSTQKPLNSQQLKATQYPIQPLLVMAGAGTGKTTILTQRVTYLIQEVGLLPSRILAFTFTNKAANEMNERIKKSIGNSLFWIGTFHSICVKILYDEIHYLNRKNNFKIVDEEECNSLLKIIYEELNIDKKNFSYKNALKAIDICKNNNIDVEDIDLFATKNKFLLMLDMKAFKKIYQKYLDKFASYNYLDFNDILNFTNLIFDNHPEVASKWAKKFDYILVDEFQDTNATQYNLIKHLAGEEFNVFAVGDEDQIIYSFRGADSSVINKFIYRFGKDHPINVIKLEENYRSTNQILKVANSLIDKNPNRIKKNLYSNLADHTKPIYHKLYNQEMEANYVCKQIEQLVDKGANYSDITILYRSNYLSRTYEHALVSHGIPYNLYGSFKFYQRTEIKDILAYLQVINNYDEMSILRIINVPRRKISDNTVKIVTNFAHDNNMSLWEALTYNSEIDELTTAQKNAINNFIDLIENLKIQDINNMETFFDYLLNKTEYETYIQNQDAKRLESVQENLNELKNSILLSQTKTNNWTLNKYLNDIAILTSLDNKKKIENAVNLMTIHGAKGLEFKHVFLVAFNDQIFPSKNCLGSDHEIAEERRLAYVAITRAKYELYISSFTNHYNGDVYLPSRFLKEINNDLIDTYQEKFTTKSSIDNLWFDSHAKPQIKMEEQYNSEQKNTYQIGDRLVHITFGEGIVIGIEGDILEISFKRPHNIKQIIFNHKSIKRQIW